MSAHGALVAGFQNTCRPTSWVMARCASFRELDVAHEVSLGRRLRLPAHNGPCNAHVALLEVDVIPAQGDLLSGPEPSKERGGEVICDLRALALFQVDEDRLDFLHFEPVLSGLCVRYRTDGAPPRGARYSTSN